MNDPLERTELTFLLGMAFQLVLTEFVREVEAAGYEELRPIHGLAFQVLRHGGATSSELAERLGVTKQAAGQIVAYLEERGYVRRVEHAEGGRRRLVVLTDRAEKHLAVAGRVMRELEARVGERLGPDELTLLRTELAGLIRGLAGADLPPLRPIW
ncbi:MULTISPECIES: MarR family winged helix-turn-helix transcriptional regulator [Nocardiopsidaceae]|jgi:DNA-binding MarR family transcriptional regulator|uniref:MarR family transcriptional regulator n=1 Tax=Streptomonospora nanhaiensis TaxID=1323731 RepID=A0ABY6YSI3_9ACTN|nr:MarR family transcriptional regulator [Streptomonospora nanhaiensis]WAE75329.1 MarR family transcriptional regulator [Streptomonospora nanhaiensis]